MRTARTAATAALAVMSLGALAACGSSSSGTSPSPAGTTGTPSGSITLYSGQHEQTTDAIITGFEKQTGIKVNVRNGDEDELEDQLQTEGSHSPADVFYTENTMPLQDLASHNLLAPLSAATLAHTPSKYNSPQDVWTGVSARISVLDYNPSKISKADLPTNVLQLADPKYKGLLGIAPGETDFQPIVISVLKAYGQARTLAWLKGIKANAGDAHTYPDNETIVNDINKGQVAFGLINQYYWWRIYRELGASGTHSKIAYLAPHDPGYVLDISGAAVLASSDNKPAAEAFVAYLTSNAGQEVISHSDSYEYPIADGVTTAQPETPFDQLQPYPITLEQIGNGLNAIDLLHQAQLL
jgi:iron(III) transport system substrate-binding protein